MDYFFISMLAGIVTVNMVKDYLLLKRFKVHAEWLESLSMQSIITLEYVLELKRENKQVK